MNEDIEADQEYDTKEQREERWNRGDLWVENIAL